MAKIKTILDELSEYMNSGKEQNIYNNIYTRGEHLAESCMNFINDIQNNLPKDESDLIVEKFISSIKNKKPTKFKNFYENFRKDKGIN